jgi:IS30 family transposase
MDRQWLAARLEAGNSIEAIAQEVARDPSTVAYWVNKHGLRSRHADRHTARGPLAREELEPLIARGMSIRDIARQLDRSPTTVRHWLRHHGLRTLRSGRAATAARRRRSYETAHVTAGRGSAWSAESAIGARGASSTP